MAAAPAAAGAFCPVGSKIAKFAKQQRPALAYLAALQFSAVGDAVALDQEMTLMKASFHAALFCLPDVNDVEGVLRLGQEGPALDLDLMAPVQPLGARIAEKRDKGATG